MKSKISPSLSQGTCVKALASPGRQVLPIEPHPFHYPFWVRTWRFTASWGPTVPSPGPERSQPASGPLHLNGSSSESHVTFCPTLPDLASQVTVGETFPSSSVPSCLSTFFPA